MKINKILSASLILVSMVFGSCQQNSDNDIFDADPSIRIKQAELKLKETLVASEHGWVVNFFPAKEEQSTGGYYLWLDFNEDNTVDVKSDRVLTDFSVKHNVFDFVLLKTIALNFPEKGEIHEFTASNPAKNRTDIEFVLSNYIGENIEFEGHMTKNQITFVKATADDKADFDQVGAMRNLFNQMKFITLKGATEKKVAFVRKPSSDNRIFRLPELGLLENENAEFFGVSIAPKFMMTSIPFVVDGQSFRSFQYINNEFVATGENGVSVVFSKD